MATQRRASEKSGAELIQDSIVRLDVDIKSAIDDLHGAKIEDGQTLNKVNMVEEVNKVREMIHEMGKKIDKLESSIGKVKRAEERAQLERLAKTHRSSLERNSGWLRKETQRVLANIDEDAREALLGGVEAPKLRGVGGNMAEEAARTTAGLGNLLGKMGEQVEASSAALGTLLSSSELIKETEEEFSTMGNAIASSGKLLCKWERRELTDQFLFVLALLLFYVTALYILRKRLGALWVFSWM